MYFSTDAGRKVVYIDGQGSTEQEGSAYATALYRRRPRRPPFLRVLSVGMGVTSSAQNRSAVRELSVRVALGPNRYAALYAISTHPGTWDYHTI